MEKEGGGGGSREEEVGKEEEGTSGECQGRGARPRLFLHPPTLGAQHNRAHILMLQVLGEVIQRGHQPARRVGVRARLVLGSGHS